MRIRRQSTQATADEYLGFHDEATGGDLDKRKSAYATMINHYYDLVTDFYEFGWGQSFHFSVRRPGESFKEATAAHERFLVESMGARPGMRIVDVGCGVGGPMRTFARTAGCEVVGVNNNAYQIEKGEKHNRKAGVDGLCSFVKADFMSLPFEDGAFDGAYTIEASCHAPDKVALFRELLRVMKPGAEFVGYEWCLTDRFDAGDAEHRRIKKGIEEGDALPDIARTHEVDEALREAGFELIDARDRALECHPSTPWYLPLTGEERTLSSIPRTPVGRSVTNVATRVMERLRIAPEGTTAVSSFLNAAADSLVEGGRTGIFTPMYYFRVRKPE
ncbi:MAG: methyltransferase domain-containing protein [Myxococcota bacterium]